MRRFVLAGLNALFFDPEVSLRAEHTQCEAGPKGRVKPLRMNPSPFH